MLFSAKQDADTPCTVNMPAQPVLRIIRPDIARPDYLSTAETHDKIADYFDACRQSMETGARSLTRVEPATAALSAHCLRIIDNLAASSRRRCRGEDLLIFNQTELADYLGHSTHITALLRHGYASERTALMGRMMRQLPDDGAPLSGFSSAAGHIVNLGPVHTKLAAYLYNRLSLSAPVLTAHNDTGPRQNPR